MTETRKVVRQFRGKKPKHKSYDRKVRQQGNTMVISLGKIIPDGWLYVRLTPLRITDTHVELLIEKLLGAEDNAQVETVNQRHQQDA